MATAAGTGLGPIATAEVTSNAWTPSWRFCAVDGPFERLRERFFATLACERLDGQRFATQAGGGLACAMPAPLKLGRADEPPIRGAD